MLTLQRVGRKGPSCVCWNQHGSSYCGTPNGQPRVPPESERLQIWLKVILIISNHVISYHIISYHIISYIIYHISYFIFHISYIIYHIQSSILGGGNDDGAHTYKDEPHPGEKQRWLLCFSEPKRSVTATWALTKYLGHLLYTQGIIILLSYIRIMSKNSSNYFRIPYNATWSGLHFFMSAVSNS